MTVWPLTIYWEDGGKPRRDLATRAEDKAEQMAGCIRQTWAGVLAVQVEEPTEDADRYEII